jgi:hypothetical protein
MNRTLFAGVLAAALAVSPAFAAKGHRAKAAHKPASQRSILDFEREAWGSDAPVKVVKKANPKARVGKKKTQEKSTVVLHPTVKVKPVAVKPVEPPKMATKTTVATGNKGEKTPEELEKEARAKKDPNQKLAEYDQLLQKDPNYPYAGDVYKDMYQLAKRNGADTLTQLKYAGRAAQALQQGRSHGPVNPKDVSNLNKVTDDLINQWIQDTIRQLKQGK